MTVGTNPSVLDPSLYIPDLRSRKRDTALADLVALAHHHRVVRDPAVLLDLLALRERLGTTAIGKGVALPNARSLTVQHPQLLVARSRRGIEWSAFDGEPVSLVLLVLSPAESGDAAHHAFLSRAGAVARLQRNRQRLLDAPNVETVMTLLREVTA